MTDRRTVTSDRHSSWHRASGTVGRRRVALPRAGGPGGSAPSQPGWSPGDSGRAIEPQARRRLGRLARISESGPGSLRPPLSPRPARGGARIHELVPPGPTQAGQLLSDPTSPCQEAR